MKLYLDDNCIEPVLVQSLRSAGHDVQVPSDVGMRGKADAVHLTHAIREARILLTRNYQDFEFLHLLLVEARGQHPGIIIVRQDNDPKRDLTARGIVRAIRKLAAAGGPIANEYIILNQWR